MGNGENDLKKEGEEGGGCVWVFELSQRSLTTERKIKRELDTQCAWKA
jgi:hypothetical protein